MDPAVYYVFVKEARHGPTVTPETYRIFYVCCVSKATLSPQQLSSNAHVFFSLPMHDGMLRNPPTKYDI